MKSLKSLVRLPKDPLLRRITIGGLGSLLLLLVLGLAMAAQLPGTLRLKKEYPQYVFDREQKTEVLKYFRGRPQSWVRLGDISEHVIKAVIVSEDWSFFSHPGYDLGEMRAALLSALTGDRVRGASTITQQLARNAFLGRDRNLWRKMKEFFVAIDLEQNFSKSEILEKYFNLIEWGDGVFGIKKASQYYFQKHPKFLTPREGAFLAMLLPSPKRYAQSFRDRVLTHYARTTISKILRKLHKRGHLSGDELTRELHAKLYFERSYGYESAEEDESSDDETESQDQIDANAELVESPYQEAALEEEVDLSAPETSVPSTPETIDTEPNEFSQEVSLRDTDEDEKAEEELEAESAQEEE